MCGLGRGLWSLGKRHRLSSFLDASLLSVEHCGFKTTTEGVFSSAVAGDEAIRRCCKVYWRNRSFSWPLWEEEVVGGGGGGGGQIRMSSSHSITKFNTA